MYALLLFPLAAIAVQLPQITPWGANSFRVQWSPPGYPITNSSFAPYLDSPLSTSPFSSASSLGLLSFINGNLRLDVDQSTGFITGTRLSDGFVVFSQTNLTFSPALARGRYPSAELQFKGHAEGETLVGMGEQGLTGRVTLEQPFSRNYIETEVRFVRLPPPPCFVSSCVSDPPLIRRHATPHATLPPTLPPTVLRLQQRSAGFFSLLHVQCGLWNDDYVPRVWLAASGRGPLPERLQCLLN